MNTLVFPLSAFQSLLAALADNPSRAAFLRVGTHVEGQEREWLAQEMVEASSAARTADQHSLFSVSLTDRPILTTPEQTISVWPDSLSGHLYLGEARWRGQLWEMVKIDDHLEPLHRIFLPGRGMLSIPVLPIAPREEPSKAHLRQELFNRLRWSRTIGALGGKDIWERLTRLRIAVIGCGRTGSLVAGTLARLGVQHLTLIDPDQIEAHNVAESDVIGAGDAGRPKAKAIAERLRTQLPWAQAKLLPIVAPITVAEARAAALTCDVLFCCADNDAARLATAILATMYHKVLVDIGTGIFFQKPSDEDRRRPRVRSRNMGADIRLVLPGDSCLLCAGNLTNYRQAIEDLCNTRAPSELFSDWNQQRAGSLRTLNQFAASLGVQMLQDLVAERITATRWAQLECDDAGQVRVNYPALPRRTEAAPCALCVKAGLGDEGLRWR
jgi:predicted dinucleotide-binding enzyme